jgi:hypothetical protein
MLLVSDVSATVRSPSALAMIYQFPAVVPYGIKTTVEPE